MDRPTTAALPDPAETDTEHLLKEAGVPVATITALLVAAGGGMTTTESLARAEALVGVEQYPDVGEFPVERGYIWTWCASVENGNPLFWDDAVAQALTDGAIAPPTMVSVWFRPHHWSPGRAEAGLALQVHFDLKELLRPARGHHDRQHHRVPHPGARG